MGEPHSEERRARKKALRVKHSTETIAAATKIAEQLSDDDSPLEQRRMQVDEVLQDRELSDAIVACVDTRKRAGTGRRIARESAVGVYCFFMCSAVLALLWIAAKWLYGWVISAGNQDLPAIAAACGQAILIRLGWHLIKFCAIYLTDSLNLASYPTVLHQPVMTTAEEDIERLERIRLLIAEMVVRLTQGDRFRDLNRELTRIEMTKSAAIWLLVQAKIGLFIKANFPPYSNRSRAYAVAVGAGFGCAIGISLASKHLSTAAQRDYLVTWAVLFVLEFLRAPRRVSATKTA